MNYQNQIEALSESQRRRHREMIVNLFTNEDKCQSSDDKILQKPLALNRANQINASLMKKSLSCDSQMTPSHSKVPTSFRDESFTIYIGAQLKTMHNARIVSRDRLSDFCQTPSAGDLNAASEFFDSRRLQLLMSLYRRDLTSVVLLVGRDPQYHIHNRTHFARICEQTAELHFDPLEIQLSQIEMQIIKANKERQNQATSPRVSGYDAPQGDSFTIDEGLFQPGDIYITYHSNIPSAQVVFHLVSDKSLKIDDISSRHPCIGGLRNIIRLSSKCAVQNITLPLLLVETMAESMTVPWCMSRAELIFKCIKGFLMEVSTGSSNSSATGGGCMAGPNVHYNINFALPSKISPSLFHQITEMFSTIFHLVPSVSA